MITRCIFTSALALSASFAAANGLLGSTAVITNTFQGAQTGNQEVDVSGFGLANNQFASVGGDVEFVDFITLYDVDISADAIAFTWSESEFAQTLSGPTPDGNHDRNYFIFDLPEGKSITAVTFDAAKSDLLEGSAEPTAEVLGPNRIVTDFSGGVIRGSGFNPVYVVTVQDAE